MALRETCFIIQIQNDELNFRVCIVFLFGGPKPQSHTLRTTGYTAHVHTFCTAQDFSILKALVYWQIPLTVSITFREE